MGNLILDDMKVIVRCEKTIIRSMRLVGGHVELSGEQGMAESDDDNLNASANKIHVQSMASANPYQAPEADNVTRVETGKRGLGVVDWLPAIGAGILAALIVFPTTCMGVLILAGVRGLKQVLSVTGTNNFLFGFCVLSAMGAALYAGWRVLHARSKDESSELLELTENGDA